MTYLRAVAVWFILTVPLAAAQPAATAPPATETKGHSEYYELLRLFVDTLDQVERNYVEDISRRELLEAAIDGMLSKLDQHSDYIAPQDLDRFKTGVESEFGGIGIQVSKQRDRGPLTIISPLVGSPAYRAGLLAGDIITHIEGEPTRELTLDDAVTKMKGRVGTPVKITVRHAAGRRVEEVELLREVVRVETVLGDHRNSDHSWNYFCDDSNGIGYIRLTGFARRTTRDLRDALEQLKDQNAKGLILDLRFNPGGLLSTAIQVSDLFVAEGRIVSTSGRNTKPQSWDARRGDLFETAPLAVLVNRFSASASEIVAACLQDHKRAVVIGERTFGKGSVQNIIELEEGRSALKLTTAGYVRPSGLNIHRFPDDDDDDEWGVRPTDGFAIEVNFQKQRQLAQPRDARSFVSRAKSGESTDNEQDTARAVTDVQETDAEPESAGNDPNDDDDPEPTDEVLAKAIAYLVEETKADSDDS